MNHEWTPMRTNPEHVHSCPFVFICGFQSLEKTGALVSNRWKRALLALAASACTARAQTNVAWTTNALVEGHSFVHSAAEADPVRALAMPLRAARQKWNVVWPAAGPDTNLLRVMRRSLSGLIATAFADYRVRPTEADSPEAWMRFVAEEYNREFKDLVKTDPGTAQRYEAIVNAGPSFVGSHVATLKSSTYLYAGGAHGTASDAYRVVDLAGGRVLHFEEVFPSRNVPRLRHALELQFRKDRSLPAPKPLRDAGLFEDTLAAASNYFADATGVGFTYADFEIAPHAEGIITIHLAWDEARELIAPDTALRAEAEQRASKRPSP